MKILLIHVSAPEVKNKLQQRALFPSLTLAHVAALFPADFDILLCDNAVKKIPFDGDFDLVGITFYGTTAAYAFTIAKHFRGRGIKVLFGGPTVTIAPDICRPYCDSLIIGEAENVMPSIIVDLKAGNLAPIYTADHLADVEHMPVPRYDLLNTSYYTGAYPVQTARGCTMQCSFCTIPILNNHAARFVPIGNVLRDVSAAIATSGARRIFFVDDNINMNPKRAIELFHALVPLRIEWYGFATWLIGMQPEILQSAAESGCRILFIGFESLSKADLKGLNKSFNHPENYKEAIGNIHAHGIHIMSSFMFGMDGDAPDVFKRTLKFVDSNRISLPVFHLFTPIPGTPVFDQFKAEGRLIENNLALFDCRHVVFEPSGMQIKELYKGYAWVLRSIYSPFSVLRRTVFRPPIGGWRNLRMQLWVIVLNLFWMAALFSTKLKERFSKDKVSREWQMHV